MARAKRKPLNGFAFRLQIGIQSRAQIAYMHIACGGRGEPGPDPSMGDLGLHLVKIGLIQRHAFFLPNLDN